MSIGYIYAVRSRFRGEGLQIHRATIEKETPKQVRLTRGVGLAFDCRVTHDPVEVHRTPEAAVDAYRARCVARRARLVEEIAKIDRELPTLDGDLPIVDTHTDEPVDR